MLRTLTLACALAGTCLAQVGPLQLHHDADLRRADAATWRGRLAAEDPAVRAAAARAVGRIREASLAAQVEARLVLPEPVASVRRELVFALGQLKAGREALEAATADDDLEVRAVALEALGKLPAADTSAERLVAGLAGEESEVAAALLAAARAYGRRVQPPPTAPEALLTALREAIPAQLQGPLAWQASYALSEVVGLASEAELVAGLAAEDGAARLFAARGLGRLPELGPDARAALHAGLHDPHVHAAAGAAWALGKHLAADSRAPLQAAAERAGPGAFHVRAAAVEALAGDLPDVEPLADVLAWFRARLDDASPSVRRAALGALACADALAPTDVDRFAGPETHAADRQSLLQALEALPQAPGAELSAALRAAPWSGSERAALRAALAPWDRAWIAPLATPTGPRDAVQAVLEATAFGAAGRLADVPSLAAHYRHALPRARQGKLTPTRAFGDPLAWAEARAAVVAAVEAIVQRERFFAPFGPLGPALALLVDALDDPDGTVREAASAALLAQFGLDRAVEPAPPVPSSVPLNLADLEVRPRVAVLHTRHGPLALELLGGEAPRHAKSFALLARAGFYDGLTFHRVIAGFVAQGLCPLGNGWGTGGVHLNDEINPVPFVRGAVGMPSSGPDTAGCQVFLTHVPTPHLDGNYTVFARVAGDDRILDLLDLDDVVERVELRP